MSRELRNILYVVGALLTLGGIVLAFLPITVAAGVTDSVNCGSPLQPSGLELIYAQCDEAYGSRGLWAAVLGVVGLLIVGAVAYMTYFASPADAKSGSESGVQGQQ